MENDAKKARIAAWTEEMDAIHSANNAYWKRSEPTVAARAQYQRRLDQLEEIRKELRRLQVGWEGSKHSSGL